jgi:chemotaxis protein CheX
MQFFENEIKEYVEFAWSTLDLKISPAKQFPENSKKTITANIQINGEWLGIVALKIEHALAKQLAVKMFSIDKAEVTDEEVNDAVSEMINIIGGNIKSILPQPNKLSLPMVDLKGGRPHFPFTELRSQVPFECEGNELEVTMHQVVADKKTHCQSSTVETS